MNFLVRDIPGFNGIAEIGIGAGSDAALTDDYKLRLYRSVVAAADTADVKAKKLAGAAVADFYRRMHAHADFAPANLMRAYLTAAYAFVYAGALSQTSRDDNAPPDGDILIIPADQAPPELTQETITVALEMVGPPEMMLQALMLGAATKVCMWTSNHHTGSARSPHPYITRCLGTLSIAATIGGDNNCKITFAHTIGHWLSTRRILAKLGAKGVATNDAPALGLAERFEFANDLRVRVQSLPATCHPLSLAVECSRPLLASPLVVALGSLVPYRVLFQTYRQMMDGDDYAQYHPGCRYLKNDHGGLAPVAVASSIWESTLGRAATYVEVLMPGSTLLRSPRLAERAYVGKWDYDPQFQMLCRNFKTMMADPAQLEQIDAAIKAQVAQAVQPAVMRAEASAIMRVLVAAEPQGN